MKYLIAFMLVLTACGQNKQDKQEPHQEGLWTTGIKNIVFKKTDGTDLPATIETFFQIGTDYIIFKRHCHIDSSTYKIEQKVSASIGPKKIKLSEELFSYTENFPDSINRCAVFLDSLDIGYVIDMSLGLVVSEKNWHIYFHKRLL